MGSDIFAKFSAYIKNPRKEANSSKKNGEGADGGAQSLLRVREVAGRGCLAEGSTC